MLKADILMKDGSTLIDVNLFRHKELGDSIVLTKVEAEKYLQDIGTVFFGGKYVQGCFIPNQVSNYKLYEDEDDFKIRIKDFVQATNSIYDKTDIADFIIDYRDDLLKLLH